MAQSSRTFRIFVSSTFSDLKAERNALQEKVFPRLRDLAAAHGCRFQAIDLRWGVSEEAALDQQTMKICLNEIARCQKTSPRPNFIVLLGDRYGWQPIPSEIPADEFMQVIPLVTNEEKDLLGQWYRRDDNAAPPVYCLQPRHVDVSERASEEEKRTAQEQESKEWQTLENKLQAILQNAVNVLGWESDDPRRIKYEASATEQEIINGALKVDDANEHVFCFLRDIQGLPKDNSAAGFREADPEAVQKQAELKERLRRQLSSNVHEYTAQWQEEGLSQKHLDQLCEAVYSELSKVILAETGKLEKVDSLDAEITAHETFGEDRARIFIGQADILKAIEKYTSGNDPHPLAIWGASGSGKSALMAKAIEEAQKRGWDMLYRFIGATPESSNGRALLESLCKQISRRYEADESTIPSEYKDLVQEFPKRLALAKPDKPLIIFLDALDQLSDTNNARNLIWLPAELPPNVHLVVSTLEGECLQALENKVPVQNKIVVQAMSMENGEAILDIWLNGIKRRFKDKQKKYLLEKFKVCGLPLYLKLAFEETRLWKSYDALPELSEDIPGILRDLFKRLSQESNHGQMLVSHSLGYLAAAKNGLSEDELLDVLSMDKEMLADFQRRSPKSPKSDRLPVVIWSRLYFDLEPYLTERSADGTNLFAFYHRQMTEACQAAYRNKTRHAELAAYFTPRPLYLEEGEQTPNLRKLSEMVYQQAWAGLSTHVEKTLLDYNYLQVKLVGQGVEELIADYTLVSKAGVSKEKEKSLSLLQGALRLSSHVLSEDPLQIPSQLTGRLLGFQERDLYGLLEQIRKEVKRPWLRPLNPCLDAPGGALLHTLVGHTSQVNDVAMTSDGSHAISTSLDGTLKVWEMESGICIRTLKEVVPGWKDYATSVALTSNGRHAILASSDHMLRLWDIESGTCLRTFIGHTDSVNDVAITPDGHYAVSAAGGRNSPSDYSLKIWDLESGACLRTLEGHTGPVKSVALMQDGRRAVSGSQDETIKVWDIQSGACLRTLESHSGTLLCLALSQDNHYAVSASGNNTLMLWNLESGECLHTLRGHKNSVEGVALTRDGHYAVSASSDKTLKVWDVMSGACLRTLEGHSGIVYALALTPDGHYAISASHDNTLKVWDIQSGPYLPTWGGHISGVTSVALMPNGRYAVSGSVDKMLKVWDLKSGACLRTLEGHKNTICSVALMPDGQRAITASLDKTLKVWDIESGTCLRTFIGHTDSVNDVALSPDGHYAVSAAGGLDSPHDYSLKIWDLESGACLQTLEGHTGSVLSVALMQDGRRAVSGSQDKTIKVWDIQSGACLRTLEGHTVTVSSVALTSDSRYAVSASYDSTLKVWDLESGTCIRTLEGHTKGVLGVTLTQDDHCAVSASQDGTLKVWNLESGTCLRTLEGHTAAVYSVALMLDDHYAVSASQDGTIKLWSLQRGVCLRTLDGHINHLPNMTLSSDGRYAVLAPNDDALKVSDLENDIDWKHTNVVHDVVLSPDGQLAVSASWDKTLKVWDVQSCTCLHTLSGYQYKQFNPISIALTPNGRCAISASLMIRSKFGISRAVFVCVR